jgi:N-methylhydantoinase A/oxoprolinase/acetone carboxylase beta subunit
VLFSAGPLATRFYRGEALDPGNYLQEPAVVVRSDTTILLGVTDRAEVDQYDNLLIEVGV